MSNVWFRGFLTISHYNKINTFLEKHSPPLFHLTQTKSNPNFILLRQRIQESLLETPSTTHKPNVISWCPAGCQINGALKCPSSSWHQAIPIRWKSSKIHGKIYWKTRLFCATWSAGSLISQVVGLLPKAGCRIPPIGEGNSSFPRYPLDGMWGGPGGYPLMTDHVFEVFILSDLSQRFLSTCFNLQSAHNDLIWI